MERKQRGNERKREGSRARGRGDEGGEEERERSKKKGRTEDALSASGTYDAGKGREEAGEGGEKEREKEGWAKRGKSEWKQRKMRENETE